MSGHHPWSQIKHKATVRGQPFVCAKYGNDADQDDCCREVVCEHRTDWIEIDEIGRGGVVYAREIAPDGSDIPREFRLYVTRKGGQGGILGFGLLNETGRVRNESGDLPGASEE